jgi:hypothetical protein
VRNKPSGGFRRREQIPADQVIDTEATPRTAKIITGDCDGIGGQAIMGANSQQTPEARGTGKCDSYKRTL